MFKLPPYYENFGKRAVKSPKYFFTDTGLLALVYAGEPFVFSDGITALRYDQVDRIFADDEAPSDLTCPANC